MQLQGGAHNLLGALLHLSHEAPLHHVLREDALVDGLEGLGPREADGKHAEVALQAGVDGEAPGRGVHAGHVLHIVDLLQCQLVAVVPGRRERRGQALQLGYPFHGESTENNYTSLSYNLMHKWLTADFPTYNDWTTNAEPNW